MSKTDKNKNEKEQVPAQTNDVQISNLPGGISRGMLLDIFIFLLNIFLMRWLGRLFLNVAQAAGDGDLFSGAAIFLFFLAIFILPPMGATLKRWHFHQRLQMQGKSSAKPDGFSLGCLFNPLVYFCLNALIYCALNAMAMSFIYDNREPDGAVFVSSILFGMVLMIFQTIIVYRYFSPPKTAPQTEFLRSPRSEMLGDACIFLNMILYQVLWNLAISEIPPRPENVSIPAEIGFRLLFVFFTSLFVYFPPRIFYFAEDINRRRVWLTILLANLPLLFRVFFSAM